MCDGAQFTQDNTTSQGLEIPRLPCSVCIVGIEKGGRGGEKCWRGRGSGGRGGEECWERRGSGREGGGVLGGSILGLFGFLPATVFLPTLTMWSTSGFVHVNPPRKQIQVIGYKQCIVNLSHCFFLLSLIFIESECFPGVLVLTPVCVCVCVCAYMTKQAPLPPILLLPG